MIVCSLPGAIVAETTGLASAAGATGVGLASVEVSSSFVERTETFPLKAGIEIINAESMNVIAAAIVNLARTEAVPRGANAVLETLLVKSAPASVLPGCKSTDPIRTTHETKNKP